MAEINKTVAAPASWGIIFPESKKLQLLFDGKP